MDNRAAKEAAQVLLTKYACLEISIENLIFILDNYGFEIIEFSAQNSMAVEHLIREYNLTDLLKKNAAFIFSKDNVKLVFIDERLSIDQKRILLAHELGHIVCGHLSDGYYAEDSFEQEHEANEFAHYLLNPSLATKSKLWIKTHKGTVIAVVAACAVLLLSVPIVHHYRQAAKLSSYYITDSGNKYHVEDCFYVQGRDIRPMTKEEYTSGTYSPCKICIH